MKIKQLIFSPVTFLSSSEASVVFNISSSHANLPNRRFSYEQFLMPKYSWTLHTSLHSQSCVLGFHIKSLLQEPQSSNSLYSHKHSS